MVYEYLFLGRLSYRGGVNAFIIKLLLLMAWYYAFETIFIRKITADFCKKKKRVFLKFLNIFSQILVLYYLKAISKKFTPFNDGFMIRQFAKKKGLILVIEKNWAIK